jgi:hypothetical protein
METPIPRALMVTRYATLLCKLLMPLLTLLPEMASSQVCQPAPSGIAAWWPGDGAAVNVLGSGDGVLVGDAGYAAGQVGLAFTFDGNADAVDLGSPVALQLQDFTIEAWISRNSGVGEGEILCYGQGGYGFGIAANGTPYLTAVGVSAVVGAFQVTDTNWHHVAVAKSGSTVVFYLDGSAYPAADYGAVFDFGTHVAIGARGDSDASSFNGMIDEVSVYGRALTAAEVATIFGAGSGGKCLAPLLAMQPQSSTVNVGTAVTFSVLGFGHPAVSYQWRKDGADLAGETNGNLNLAVAQSSVGGNYTVVLTNSSGAATSSVARLDALTTLTLNIVGQGSVSLDPNRTVFTNGGAITLTAEAQPNNEFVRWSGEANTSGNPLVLAMTTNHYVTAEFQPTFTLQIATNGNGTVSVSPAKLHYSQNEGVQLLALPARWFHFVRWGGDGATNNPRTIVLQSNAQFTAVFTPDVPLDTVEFGGITRLAPVGMPAVLVDGVFILVDSVRARGSAEVTLATSFPSGTLLYTLDGSDPSSTGRLYTGPFQVSDSLVLRTVAYDASFTHSVVGDPLTIVILPTLTGLTDGGGTIDITPPTGDYLSNSLAVVTATPAPGWNFLQWLGDAYGTNPVVTVSMTRNKTVRAMFGTAINITVVGGGAVMTSPSSPLYPYGSQFQLTGVPATGNYLALWANAGGGQTLNPLFFTVTNANPTITAVFASLGGAQTNALTVIPTGRGAVTLSPSGNRYPHNASVLLQATPDPGQQFLGWSGAASGSQNPLTVTMNSNKVITASFSKRPSLFGEASLTSLIQDGFRLTLTGESGTNYTILGSTNLTDWTPLGTLTNTYGTVQLTDPAATNLAQRFYRALGN